MYLLLKLGVELVDFLNLAVGLRHVPGQSEIVIFPVHGLAANGDLDGKCAAILAIVAILDDIVRTGGRVVPHALQVVFFVLHCNLLNRHLQQLFAAVAQADTSLLIDIQKAAFAVQQEKRIGKAF